MSRSSTDPRAAGPDERAAPFDPEAFRRREPRALDTFFRAHFSRVFGLARCLCANTADAEDLTQEVFLRIWQAADSFDAERPIWPWLRQITCNVLRDRKRVAHRIPRLLEQEEGFAADHVVDREDPPRVVTKEEQDQFVRAALTTLPEDQRTTVILRAWQGCSHEEIARLTDSTAETSRKRYSRAIVTLGRLLEKLL